LSRMNKIFKLLNGLATAVFVLAAVVQYNDPDALRWIVVYLAAAVACLDHLTGTRLPWLPPSLLCISLTWCILLAVHLPGSVHWSDVVASIEMRSQSIEQVREAGGLLLVVFWCAVLIFKGPWFHRSSHRGTRNDPE